MIKRYNVLLCKNRYLLFSRMLTFVLRNEFFVCSYCTYAQDIDIIPDIPKMIDNESLAHYLYPITIYSMLRKGRGTNQIERNDHIPL